MRIELPSPVRAFKARDIAPNEVHAVAQGTLNLWHFANTYVAELVTSDAWYITAPGAYINTTPPQEIADDIVAYHGDNTMRELSAAAATLGSTTSDAKAAAARENGKKGGRPVGTTKSK